MLAIRREDERRARNPIQPLTRFFDDMMPPQAFGIPHRGPVVPGMIGILIFEKKKKMLSVQKHITVSLLEMLTLLNYFIIKILT